MPKLRDMLDSYGITQSWLAERLNISRQAISGRLEYFTETTRKQVIEALKDERRKLAELIEKLRE